MDSTKTKLRVQSSRRETYSKVWKTWHLTVKMGTLIEQTTVWALRVHLSSNGCGRLGQRATRSLQVATRLIGQLWFQKQVQSPQMGDVDQTNFKTLSRIDCFDFCLAHPPSRQDLQMAFINHYALLQVGRTADAKEISRNYKALSILFHPDQAGASIRSEATQKMQQLNRARMPSSLAVD
jgi:hypothetical protein